VRTLAPSQHVAHLRNRPAGVVLKDLLGNMLSGSDAVIGDRELPWECSAGFLHTAARSTPPTWHTIQHHTLEVHDAEMGLLAESTVHESTL